jgi:hypothetical protein
VKFIIGTFGARAAERTWICWCRIAGCITVSCTSSGSPLPAGATGTWCHRRPDGALIPDAGKPLRRAVAQLKLDLLDDQTTGGDPPDTS